MDTNYIAGVCAGAATTIVNHPLDVIKIRLQLHKEPLRILLSQLSLRDYYRGVLPNLIGNISSWGMYFGMYELLKPWISKYTTSSTVVYLGLLMLAGVSTLVITNPIWVVKTRMLGGDHHRSMVKLVLDMINNEGITSLWKGMVPLLFSVGQALLQFTFYDHGKQWVKTTDRENTTTEHVYLLAASKVAAMVIMYPAQVVKARLQYQKESKRMVDIIREAWTQRAFYLGLSANIVRVVPATVTTFVVYERVKAFLAHQL